MSRRAIFGLLAIAALLPCLPEAPAQQKAHRLPVLISIPLVACMLPVMIGVLMLPAAIRVARAVFPALHG